MLVEGRAHRPANRFGKRVRIAPPRPRQALDRRYHHIEHDVVEFLAGGIFFRNPDQINLGIVGEELDDIVFDVVVSTVEGLPRARRRDPDALSESVRRAVRSALNEHWGKKPLCLVHVLTV
jgi:mRNA degradation ribonuclease J1/J2